jgi:hypothetical protein
MPHLAADAMTMSPGTTDSAYGTPADSAKRNGANRTARAIPRQCPGFSRFIEWCDARGLLAHSMFGSAQTFLQLV